jgi:hypothetical protein
MLRHIDAKVGATVPSFSCGEQTAPATADLRAFVS